MLKKIISCLLLVAILLQVFTQVIVYIDYYSNTSAFAKNCVNKYRPKLHCNGKCQLMKKLEQQEKKDGQTAERKISFPEVNSSRSFFATIDHISTTDIIAYNIFPDRKVNARSRSIFHPPGA